MLMIKAMIVRRK